MMKNYEDAHCFDRVLQKCTALSFLLTLSFVNQMSLLTNHQQNLMSEKMTLVCILVKPSERKIVHHTWKKGK